MFKVDYKTIKLIHKQFYNKFYKHNLEEFLWQTNIHYHLLKPKTLDNLEATFLT